MHFDGPRFSVSPFIGRHNLYAPNTSKEQKETNKKVNLSHNIFLLISLGVHYRSYPGKFLLFLFQNSANLSGNRVFPLFITVLYLRWEFAILL